MKRLAMLFITAGLFIVWADVFASNQEDIEVWKSFVQALQKGEMTLDRIRPYYESLRKPLFGYLKTMKENAIREEWEAAPETYRVGNKVHYLIPLTYDGEKVTYCFTLLDEEDNWYFQHMEAIFIRLDKISSLPTSEFPDLPEEQKAHMREEIRVSEQVRLFNLLSKEKGKDFAFNWFKDGAGYFLAARVWVPFVPSSKAFILYVCWEQANLKGNEVTLEKLEDDEALIRMKLYYFRLYREAAHLKQQISFEDYRQIFETVWQDRALNAGWKLQVNYDGEACLFRFKKKHES